MELVKTVVAPFALFSKFLSPHSDRSHPADIPTTPESQPSPGPCICMLSCRPLDLNQESESKAVTVVRLVLFNFAASKAVELVKVARSEGENFDCATWLHRARELPKEGFKSQVERHLTGKETEPREIIYFKLYKNQLPVVEKAIETAALMLGSDKSRGYCLEMICADFLAGANVREGETEKSDAPASQRSPTKTRRKGNTLHFVRGCSNATGGDVKIAARRRTCRFII
jgi:hypothetical protein